MTDDQRRAYVIADNKLAEQAGWDKELLKLEIGSLNRAGFEIDALGFSDKELEKLLAPEAEAPPVVSPPIDELGVIVSCADKDEQEAAYDLLTKHGFGCRTAALKGTVTG